MYRVVDTHAHLSDLEDLRTALERARGAGVCAIIAVSANLKTGLRTLEIAEEYPGYVYPAVGLHPTEIGPDYHEDLMFIEARAGDCVAVGEVGLDFWRRRGEPRKGEEERRRQVYVYTKQLEIAKRRGKPVLVHSRGAWALAHHLAVSMDISKAIFHWFTGPLRVLRAVLDSGYLVSATPAVEYSRAHREAVREVPLEQLVLETDCPVAYRGIPSEPADVVRTLRGVAELKGVSEGEVAEVTTRNAREFFDLP